MADKEFYVDEDLCTNCGECYAEMPDNFADKGDAAEVTSTEVEDTEKLEKLMEDCPANAILWRE